LQILCTNQIKLYVTKRQLVHVILPVLQMMVHLYLTTVTSCSTQLSLFLTHLLLSLKHHSLKQLTKIHEWITFTFC